MAQYGANGVGHIRPHLAWYSIAGSVVAFACNPHGSDAPFTVDYGVFSYSKVTQS